MAKYDKLKKLGFREANDDYTPRLIMALAAMEKQGKSHFALTAPAPIAVINTDIGLEGVVSKFTKEKLVFVLDTPVPHDANDAPEAWGKVEAAYDWCLRDSDVRTIVFDTATEVWELLRLAKFGKLTQVMPYHYGPVNAVYRKMIRRAYDSDKNLILLHKMKPKYINDKRTADYEPQGFSDTPYLVQLNAQTFIYEPDEGGGEPEFSLYIKDSRHDPSLIGTELSGPLCNFPTLAQMVYEDSDPEDWE